MMTQITEDQNPAPPGVIHVWVSPPNAPIPTTRDPVRIAVGTPDGVSSNSWRVWVKGLDTYVMCRDNFREIKISLHASGIWRVALTEGTIKARPELVLGGGDRVIHRRRPDLSHATKALIGFQIIFLKEGLYLQRSDRTKWPKSVVFVEPPQADTDMTVLSVTVVPSTAPLVLRPNTRGIVVALLPLGQDHTVQVVATHENDAVFKPLLRDAFRRSVYSLPEGAIFTAHGHRPDQTPWFSAVPFRKFA
ncbi:hypothetical protein [Candidatus Nitrospira neomarina]|uniref:Uncharacterized protein n=1 Tax=Candidatus Nitrospira neomarina TaxID=3020899 RepID=A0AA96GMQ7_9BACT|nr:hypothetical protein [Candidatus Nitrospira neomarina]WNM62013.1 hypothetical protein PQG83_20075 [Candidatus Nitrospira neomarina]